MSRKQKEREAYHELLRSDEQYLPVENLPQVQREQRKEYRRTTAFRQRLGHTVLMGMEAIDSRITPKRWRQARQAGLERHGIYTITPYEKDLREKHRKAGEIAVQRFRDTHPNIANVEEENARKHQKAAIQRSIQTRSQGVIDYFSPAHASSLSKAVPRRNERSLRRPEGFQGDYSDLARNTLQDAIKHRRQDDSIPLLGTEVAQERFSEKEMAQIPYDEISRSEEEYLDGGATSLWKLGFLEFDSERMINYAGGQFNPDITWTSSHDVTTAKLPFNPDNEFHRMLLPEDRSFMNPAVQVENDRGQMSLRVVEAPVPAQQPVAMAA